MKRTIMYLIIAILLVVSVSSQVEMGVNIISLPSSLSVLKTMLSPGVVQLLEGKEFTANSQVQINLINKTGQIVNNFPINKTTDASKEFNFFLNTQNLSNGNYTFEVKDFINSRKNRNISFEVREQYVYSGIIFDEFNSAVDSHSLVYSLDGEIIHADDEVYNITLS